MDPTPTVELIHGKSVIQIYFFSGRALPNMQCNYSAGSLKKREIQDVLLEWLFLISFVNGSYIYSVIGLIYLLP